MNAVATYPAAVAQLVEASQAHKRDLARNESKIPNVLEFLRWAAEETA